MQPVGGIRGICWIEGNGGCANRRAHTHILARGKRRRTCDVPDTPLRHTSHLYLEKADGQRKTHGVQSQAGCASGKKRACSTAPVTQARDGWASRLVLWRKRHSRTTAEFRLERTRAHVVRVADDPPRGAASVGEARGEKPRERVSERRWHGERRER